MHHMNPEMKSCVDECMECYSVCVSSAMGHCLEMGGQAYREEALHADDGLRRNLQDGRSLHADRIAAPQAHLWRVRGDLHTVQCADDCERLGDMQECVDACCRCAESCRKMAA